MLKLKLQYFGHLDRKSVTHPSWVAPQAWLSFIELDKAVVLV